MGTQPDSAGPRIAYLTTQYPSVSHTFIRREIEGLEALGYTILRLSIRPGSAVVDPADIAEASRTYACLAQPLSALLLAAIRVCATRPAGVLRAAAAAWSMYRRSERGLVRHLAYLLEAGALLPLLRQHGITHVHVHFGTNAAAVARLIRRLGGPGYSMTAHGPDEFDAPIGLSLRDKIREAAFVVGVSSYGAAQLRRWAGPEDWDKIKVVHCTVDTFWLTAPVPIPEGSKMLVSVGRLSAQKGQLVLIDAFARVAEMHPDARLILVGDGEMRAAVEARIARNGLEDRVTIAGWQSGEQVRDHIRAARALVLPSFAEGLPVVIMEALAQERPVISTFVAGIPELVRPGENGWLVPAADGDALASAMLEVLATPEFRLREMGRSGARRVHTAHGIETEVRKLDALFREAVRRGGAGY